MQLRIRLLANACRPGLAFDAVAVKTDASSKGILGADDRAGVTVILEPQKDFLILHLVGKFGL